MQEHLTRTFSPKESSMPFIIPALKNGCEVLVTAAVAREFKLANPALIVGGKVHRIDFKKDEIGLWLLSMK
jgi:hypothetical protein